MHFGASSMAAGGQTWSKFKDKMKELRQGKRAKKDSCKAAKELETLVDLEALAQRFREKHRNTLELVHASSCPSKTSTKSPSATSRELA